MKIFHRLLRLAFWPVLVLHLSAGNAMGQFPYEMGAGFRSLDTPADPATVAMGESFVALQGNPAALMSNPAGLADLEGIQLRYARRSYNFHSSAEGMGYWSVYGSVATSIGTVGAIYSRFSLGDIYITGPSSPTPIGVMKPRDELIGVGVAHKFSRYVSAGFAAKTYGGYLESGFANVVKRPWLFDFGLQLAFPDIFAAGTVSDKMTAGISVQNVGTDFRLEVPDFSYVRRTREVTVPLPRLLRVGLAYDLSMGTSSDRELSPFGLLATMEYRYLAYSGSGKQDFWGVGLETRIFELFKARIGGFVQPSSSIYGKNGTIKVRYGAGIDLPLNRLGIEVPLRVMADYAAIPLHRPDAGGSGRVSLLHSFSASLAYDTRLF